MHSGLAIFVLFFGVAMVDAIRGGHWLRVALWLAAGLLFYLLGRRRRDA